MSKKSSWSPGWVQMVPVVSSAHTSPEDARRLGLDSDSLRNTGWYFRVCDLAEDTALSPELRRLMRFLTHSGVCGSGTPWVRFDPDADLVPGFSNQADPEDTDYVV